MSAADLEIFHTEVATLTEAVGDLITDVRATQTAISIDKAAAHELAAEAAAAQSVSSATLSSTKADEAAASAAASLASKNAAAASQTAASQSAATASDRASSASTSATTATTKASEASTSATSAAGSAATATTKASEAGTSASIAATKASEASSSSTSASSSMTKASQWAENAENTTVEAGKYSAKHHALKAAASASAASSSQTSAASSASAATTKASEASTSATNAAASAATASTKASESSTSATNSSASATKASQWAENAENTTVETGKYSAKHHALKAAASATSASSSASTATTRAGEAATSATNAANSAATATTKASEASASATTATTKASEASTSATSASTSMTKAGQWAEANENTAVETGKYSAKHHAIKSAASAASASSSQSSASTSASTATTKASEAATSATNSAASASTATTKASEAATSAANAAASATTATAKASEASTSATNAAASASTATTKATEASTSATTAGVKATEASNSATSAATSSTKAGQWADANENVAVETGKYSAKHHAIKAAASATSASTSAASASTSAGTVTTKAGEAATSATNAANSAATATTKASEASTSATNAANAKTAAQSAKTAAEAARDEALTVASSLTGTLSELGSVDLSSGAYPATPASAGFWKVTAGGTVGGVDYGVGDTLVYSKNLGQFYKIDNTESVTSVNGKTGVVSLTAADVGAVSTTGNAATASKLQTARTINGAAFDGSADITVVDATKEPAIPAGTTAQYVAGNKTLRTFAADVRAAALTGLSTATNSALAAADTVLAAFGKLQAQITGLATSKLDATANAVSASKLQTARTIGGVAFDGTANINLPGVNAAGNQSTSGNAATATKLATARTIGGVSFDGTANINLPGVNTAGNQNTSGNAATATKLQTARTINGVAFDGSANITVADSTKLPLAGGTMTGPIDLNRSGAIASGLSWYSPSYNAWQEYMGPAGVASQGVRGNVTPPVGSLVSSWGRRSYIENEAGYGWVFESAANGSTTPTIMMELSSNTGAAKFTGAITAPAFNGDLAGNAATATALQTARTINGVSFNGTADITVADATKLPLTGGTLTGTLNGTKGVFTGVGNDYYSGGLEVVGNGPSNTVFPTMGFHQPGLYAASLQLRGGTDFRFYAQGATSYASVTAAQFNGSGAGLWSLHAGNLSMGTVPDARMSGTYTGMNITGNAGSANRAGMLNWTAYGGGQGVGNGSHVIFDASNSVAPSGKAIDNANPEIAWTGTYPTLMGWNGTNTYGVRVDRARYAEWLSSNITITVGSTAKAVNVGSNVAWTLGEIGAAAASHSHSAATTSAAGFMSAADKAKLDGIQAGATAGSSAPTADQVGAATTGLGVGAVGSYAFLGRNTYTNPGAVVAGSSLWYAGGQASSYSSPPGTWRCMGYIGTYDRDGNLFDRTLWLRIS